MQSSIASHFVGIPGGLLMSVIAFCTVFIVIAGLMLMMMALKAFATSVDNREKAKAATQTTSAPTTRPSAPQAPVAASVSPVADDDELVAVITAAIAAACGTGARVVSFKPAAPRASSSPWRMTGILQNSEGFAD